MEQQTREDTDAENDKRLGKSGVCRDSRDRQVKCGSQIGFLRRRDINGTLQTVDKANDVIKIGDLLLRVMDAGRWRFCGARSFLSRERFSCRGTENVYHLLSLSRPFQTCRYQNVSFDGVAELHTYQHQNCAPGAPDAEADTPWHSAFHACQHMSTGEDKHSLLPCLHKTIINQ